MNPTAKRHPSVKIFTQTSIIVSKYLLIAIISFFFYEQFERQAAKCACRWALAIHWTLKPKGKFPERAWRDSEAHAGRPTGRTFRQHRKPTRTNGKDSSDVEVSQSDHWVVGGNSRVLFLNALVLRLLGHFAVMFVVSTKEALKGTPQAFLLT
jgi:hypothetical protein